MPNYTNYRFTHRVQQDLKSIIDYTPDIWGAVQASTYVDGLKELAEQLAKSPKLGKSRDDLFSGLRVFSYEKHELYYFEESSGIVVARVSHQSMDKKRQLSE